MKGFRCSLGRMGVKWIDVCAHVWDGSVFVCFVFCIMHAMGCHINCKELAILQYVSVI